MIQPQSFKQLFLDNDAIEKMYGLRRTLNQPERMGPGMRPDRSRNQVSLRSTDSPKWNSEKSVWEIWYHSGYVDPGSGDIGQRYRTHYAVSADGLNWDRPSLGFCEENGSKDNNDLEESSSMFAFL